MKYSNFISIILLLSVLGTACNKDDGSSQNNLINSNPIEGRWKVESFIKDNVNLTSQFNGYTFSCNSNGSLNINGNGDSFNCNWEWNNNNHEMCHFNIEGCSTNSPLMECEGDWYLISNDSNSCHFKSYNPYHKLTMTWTKI